MLADQKRAIDAIPSYVQHATNFWVCAPSGVTHVDAHHECNYDTWLARGWCRMEEAALNLVRLGDGRPLFVCQPIGEAPRVTTQDKIDRMWNMSQRYGSVLTGAFSCCRLNHKVTSSDGQVTTIGCDKLQLKSVLHGLFEEKLELLRSHLDEEGGRDLPFEKRMGMSVQTKWGAFSNIWPLVTLKPILLADTVEEPDFVAEGWSKEYDALGPDDYEAFCRGGNGFQGGYDADPERDVNMMGWKCVRSL